MTNAELALSPDATSPRAARAFVRATLEHTRAQSCVDVAQLLVSELVTNAVLHARSPMVLALTVEDDRLRVEVRDRDERLPELFGGAHETFAGRGLHIVAGLADEWGAVELPGGGKAVWFTLGCR